MDWWNSKRCDEFYKKAEACLHENLSPNYDVWIWCGTPHCNGSEVHCLDCGAYISKCGCNCESGISGWSYARRRAHEKRKK